MASGSAGPRPDLRLYTTREGDLTLRRVAERATTDQGNGHAIHPGGFSRAACCSVRIDAALAADLTIWWNKSYYPEEDQQFDKIVADFEKTGLDVEYVFYTNEDVPRKVLAALTAGEPPDLSYGFLFDLQHTARWAGGRRARGRLGRGWRRSGPTCCRTRSRRSSS